MWRMTDLFEKGFRPTNKWKKKKMFQLKGNASKSNRNSEMSDHRNLRPFNFDWLWVELVELES